MSRSMFTPFARIATIVVAGFAALLLPGAPAGATTSGWATATNLSSSMGMVESISCWSAGNCVAVGQDWDTYVGSIATEVDGTWGAPVDVANTYDLSSVWCSDASHCTVAGVSLFGNSMRPTVVVKTPAGWQEAMRLTGSNTSSAYVSGVSCVDATNCIVVGMTGDGHIGYFSEVDGTWDTGITPGSSWGQLSSVSCLSSGTCTAVSGRSVWRGSTTSLTLQTTIDETTSGADYLWSISCVDALHCTAVGSAYYGNVPVVASTSDGTNWTMAELPGTYELFSDSSVDLRGVSCTSATQCVAVGSKGSWYSSEGLSSIGIEESGGSWGEVTLIDQPISGYAEMIGISCGSSSRCEAGGQAGGYPTIARYAGGSQSTPSTPSISNLPESGTYGGSFTPTVTTTGDGTTSVTSTTTDVCTVGESGVVTFEAAGLCTLVAHVAAGSLFSAADGVDQGFTVARGTPHVPNITNMPATASIGGSFSPQLHLSGDGTRSVTSSTPSTCTVNGSGLVTFGASGTCTLVAHVAESSRYVAIDAPAQSVLVTPTAPRMVRVVARSGGAVVTWKPPTSTSGSIVAYAAVARNAGGTVVSACFATPSNRRCKIAGLTPGQSYGISVFASERISTGRSQRTVVASAESASTTVLAR